MAITSLTGGGFDEDNVRIGRPLRGIVDENMVGKMSMRGITNVSCNMVLMTQHFHFFYEVTCTRGCNNGMLGGDSVTIAAVIEQGIKSAKWLSFCFSPDQGREKGHDTSSFSSDTSSSEDDGSGSADLERSKWSPTLAISHRQGLAGLRKNTWRGMTAADRTSLRRFKAE